MPPIDTDAFLAIVIASATAAGVGAVLAPRILIPVVVLELLLGVVIGPEVLDLAQADEFIEFFASLGLGMLFFFAGYEIDFRRIRGEPLRLALLGWVPSLAIAYACSGALAAAGVVLSWLFVGSALATTAIGTLIPILSDAGEMRTRFGTYLLAAGAMGEFGPILLVFSTKSTGSSLAILVAFVALAVIAGVVAVRSVGRAWNVLERTLESSGQLAVRSAMRATTAASLVAAAILSTAIYPTIGLAIRRRSAQ